MPNRRVSTSAITSQSHDLAFQAALAPLGVSDRIFLGLSMIDACEDCDDSELANEMLYRHLDLMIQTPLPKK